MGTGHLPGEPGAAKRPTQRCAVCHDRASSHRCKVVPDTTSSGWLSRLSREPVSGQLHADGLTVWSCDHEHQSARDAFRCAVQMLERLQREDVPQTQLPRPRMTERPEVWPARIEVPGLGAEAWREIRELFRDRCRYCGVANPSDREHRVPLSRDGPNRITNIVPACSDCNQAKGSATEEEFLGALRRLWGRRVPRAPARLDERLCEIEQRHAPHSDTGADRGVILLSKVAVPRSRLFPVPTRAEFIIHRNRQVPVAGISYYQHAAAKVVGSGRSRDGLVALVPDPTNAHDPHAVGVWHVGGQLGWLPRDVASEVSGDLLDYYQHKIATVARVAVFQGKGFIGARVKLDLPIETRPA